LFPFLFISLLAGGGHTFKLFAMLYYGGSVW